MKFPSFLRVVVSARSELIDVNATTAIRKTTFDRTDVEMTKIFAQALGFTYELMTPSDGQLGTPLPNGTWTGMVGMVHRNEADVIISFLAISELRSQVVDFSYPFNRASITFGASKPEYVSDVASFLRPFSWDLWYAILVCLIVVPCLYSMLFLRRKHKFPKPSNRKNVFSKLFNRKHRFRNMFHSKYTLGKLLFHRKRDSGNLLHRKNTLGNKLFRRKCTFSKLHRRRYAFVKMFLATFGTLLRQSMLVNPEHAREYVMIGSWIVSGMFLGFAYTAILLSFLTFPPLFGVRTIPELAAAVEAGKYECTTYPGAFVIPVLLNGKDRVSQIIGRSLYRTPGTTDIDGALGSRISGKKVAFIVGRDSLTYLKKKYFVSEDEFFPALSAVALPKDFCCVSQLNHVIKHIWVSGMYQKLKEESSFLMSLKLRSESKSVKKTTQGRLTLTDFDGTFYVLLAGYLLGTIAFVVELIVGKSPILGNMRHSVQRAFRLFKAKRIIMHLSSYFFGTVRNYRQTAK